jgi:2-dehydro-3-deoxyphosphogluconate aldolase/(4S)-4-hydroxy-2-oxoglutarate aldolase
MIDGPIKSGVVAVIRARSAVDLRPAARALVAGGVSYVEITLTTPGATHSIRALQDVAGCVVGAGTVLDVAAARDVIAAGARFVVSPAFDTEVLACCKERGVPYVPGAFTPTEIVTAQRAGADLIKLFPASAVGPSYIRDVLAPLPSVRLIPSGGVTLENAGDWIRAGAAAVSLGSALVSEPLLAPAGAAELTARARALVASVARARA